MPPLPDNPAVEISQIKRCQWESSISYVLTVHSLLYVEEPCFLQRSSSIVALRGIETSY